MRHPILPCLLALFSCNKAAPDSVDRDTSSEIWDPSDTTLWIAGAGEVYILSGARLLGATGTLREQSLAVIEGQYDLDSAGSALVSLGDIDGDGLGDLLVGSSAQQINGNINAKVVFGRQLEAGGTLRLSNEMPTIEGELAGFGRVDVTGDGVVDAFTTYGDEIWVFDGATLGAAPPITTIVDSDEERLLPCAVAGDMDGDDIDDIWMSAPMYGYNTNAETTLGALYLWSGATLAGGGTRTTSDAQRAIVGTPEEPLFGGCLAAGDVDGDEVSDVWSWQSLYSGTVALAGATATDTMANLTHAQGNPTAIAAGDFDGDGRGEALSWTWWFDDVRVAHFAWHAADTLTGEVSVEQAQSTSSPPYLAMLGAISISDLDNDGIREFVVARTLSGEGSEIAILSGDADLENPSSRLLSDAINDLAGASIVELGDVDGDGIADLAVGAPHARPHNDPAPRLGEVAEPCAAEEEAGSREDAPSASIVGWSGHIPADGPSTWGTQFYNVTDTQRDAVAARRYVDGAFIDETPLDDLSMSSTNYSISWTLGTDIPEREWSHLGFVLIDAEGNTSECYNSLHSP